ncbi:DUF302 domain-containing protein [Hydrogenimonas sp.]
MKKLVFVLLLMSAAVLAAENGMAGYVSRYGVEETTKRLVEILRKKGVTLFKVIDHSEGAAAAGLELRPAKLVIFGNPKIGTPLMQCSQTLGLDLPMKMLIYKDEKGVVHALYNTKTYLMWRHGIAPDCAAESQKKMDKAIKMFAKYATGNLKGEGQKR